MATLRELMPHVISLLEFDAASYDLSARFGKRKTYIKSMRKKEDERRSAVEKIRKAMRAEDIT